MLMLEPPERLDFSKPQDWPAWKQHFEWLRWASKLNKEDDDDDDNNDDKVY